jgi:hypothetical protein
LICIERGILENAASKLDSFEVMNLEKDKLIMYKVACDSLVSNQKAIISIQELLIASKDNEISKYKDLESSYKGMVDVGSQYNDFLKKENKKLRNKNKVYLIGGGVLTIGLTTALLISLFQ